MTDEFDIVIVCSGLVCFFSAYCEYVISKQIIYSYTFFKLIYCFMNTFFKNSKHIYKIKMCELYIHVIFFMNLLFHKYIIKKIFQSRDQK